MLFVHPDISQAHTLDKSFYTDDDLFEQSKKKIFGKCWHLVAHHTDIAEADTCFPISLYPGFLNEPVLLTRDRELTLHCMPNVCTHRGNLLVEKACKQNQLRCRYHGRKYMLDGQFHSMPEFKDVQYFPEPSDHLINLPLKEWGPFIFASLDEKNDATPYFDDMIKRLHWLPINEYKYRPEFSKTYEVKAHWALYCENYLEGFHIPFVHGGLNSVLDFNNYTTELFDYSVLQTGISKEAHHIFDIPETSVDFGKKVAAFYFWVFPNLMFNFYPWGLSVNIIEPVNKELTRVRFQTYVWKEELYTEGLGDAIDKIEKEDEEIVEAVQQGIKSKFYQHGRYSVHREQGTHHFHRLLAEIMNGNV